MTAEYVYRVTSEPPPGGTAHRTRRLKRTLKTRNAIVQILAANEKYGPESATSWRRPRLDRREVITIERALVTGWEVIDPSQLKERP
jgi:hypothetical protein